MWPKEMKIGLSQTDWVAKDKKGSLKMSWVKTALQVVNKNRTQADALTFNRASRIELFWDYQNTQ